MRDRAASACFKHLDRAVKHVIGNRNAVTARILGVGGTGQHFCFCGKPADFHIVQKEESRGEEKSRSQKSNSGQKKAGSSGG